MKNIWYGDNRDIVKWSGLLHLCGTEKIESILYVVFYREEKYPNLKFSGNQVQIPKNVLTHFRNLPDIKKLTDSESIDITILDSEFINSTRDKYIENVCQAIKENKTKKLIFLDPDTGLSPIRCQNEHVDKKEVNKIWKEMDDGDYLVLYQHRFWPKNGDWIEIRQKELAECINLNPSHIETWSSSIASDVVFYFVKKELDGLK